MKLVLKLPLTLPRPSLDVKVVQVEVVQEGAWVSYTGESVRSMEGGDSAWSMEGGELGAEARSMDSSGG